MNAQDICRKKLFNRFARNLELVKQHPGIAFESEFDNGYTCPICLEVRFEENLFQYPDRPENLTLEDVPLRSLGGQADLLTCKNCNSTSGHRFDAALYGLLKREDLKSFKAGAKGAIHLEVDGVRTRADMEIDDDGNPYVEIRSRNSNPAHVKAIQANIKNAPFTFRAADLLTGMSNSVSQNLRIGLQFRHVDETMAKLSLLRIAYLIGFKKFGYSWLLNKPLMKVREQFSGAHHSSLSGSFLINHYFPDEHLGVNILSSPAELRCFLVIFDLDTGVSKRRFAVALPGPLLPGIDVYSAIERTFNGGDATVDIRLEYLGDNDFVATEDLVFASPALWLKYCPTSS